jgi:hypothetical protein
MRRAFPDIFTHVYVADAVSDKTRRHKVITSFIDRLPRAAHSVQEIPAADAAWEPGLT